MTHTSYKNAVVMTADMTSSTRFPSELVDKWLQELLEVLRTHSHWLLTPEIYRGDSLQGVFAEPAEALKVALLARVVLRSKAEGADLRIALGIGEIFRLTERPGTSDGEAFRLSGQLSDQMHNYRARIGLALPHPSQALNDILNLMEAVVENWTPPQSEVIKGLLTGETISQAASRISISQSAASQRVAAARWWAIEPLLHTFSTLIHPFLHHD